MEVRALVIARDKTRLKDIREKIESLAHEVIHVATQKEALKVLSRPQAVDYVIMDLEVQVEKRGRARLQNGVNLIRKIRALPHTEKIPIFAGVQKKLASEERAVEAMWDQGANSVVHMPLPDEGFTLEVQITAILEKRRLRAMRKKLVGDGARSVVREPSQLYIPGHVAQAPESSAPHPKPGKSTPFNSTKRQLVIEKERVTVCGIEVWKDCAQPDLKRVLERLSEKGKDGFVRVKGTVLDKDLGRNASNPIARRIKDFRDRASSALKEAGLDCGPEDIVSSRGGYHFTPWMEVCVEAQGAKEPEPSAPLNERQTWILAQIEKGVPLRLKNIISHTRKNRSTVNRDLKELRQKGMICLHEEGHYIHGSGNQ